MARNDSRLEWCQTDRFKRIAFGVAYPDSATCNARNQCHVLANGYESTAAVLGVRSGPEVRCTRMGPPRIWTGAADCTYRSDSRRPCRKEGSTSLSPRAAPLYRQCPTAALGARKCSHGNLSEWCPFRMLGAARGKQLIPFGAEFQEAHALLER